MKNSQFSQTPLYSKKGQILIEALFVVAFCVFLILIANESTKKFHHNYKKNETFTQRNKQNYGKTQYSNY
jgi:hypothetical protein